MNNEPLEDVFPIEHGDIPASYVSLPEGINKQNRNKIPWGEPTFPSFFLGGLQLRTHIF